MPGNLRPRGTPRVRRTTGVRSLHRELPVRRGRRLQREKARGEEFKKPYSKKRFYHSTQERQQRKKPRICSLSSEDPPPSDTEDQIEIRCGKIKLMESSAQSSMAVREAAEALGAGTHQLYNGGGKKGKKNRLLLPYQKRSPKNQRGGKMLPLFSSLGEFRESWRLEKAPKPQGASLKKERDLECLRRLRGKRGARNLSEDGGSENFEGGLFKGSSRGPSLRERKLSWISLKPGKVRRGQPFLRKPFPMRGSPFSSQKKIVPHERGT